MSCRARIRRHDQDDVAEIDLLAVVVGELAVIHHLQQDVVEVRMGLLDFVEQQHAMRVLVDRVGQQSALVEADIAGRRADQPRDRVALHVFGHVEADQLRRRAATASCLATSVLPTPVGPGEEVAADRLFAIAQPGASELDRRGQRADRLVLAVDDALQRLARCCSTSASSFETILGGMRAIVAIVASISLMPIVFLRLPRAAASALAPVSSITSIALSGSLRSWM